MSPTVHNAYSAAGANGTYVRASSAINALFGVDNKFAVTLGDSLNRAAVSASAAGNAFVRNLVCHNIILLIFFLYNITFRQIMQYIF